MFRRLLAGVVVLVTALLVAAIVVVHLQSRYSDPASARCNHAPATFGTPRVFSDHREVDVSYICAGATIVGTLMTPADSKPHPAVVWVHGAGESPRLPYRGTPLAHELVAAGLAFFSYDKRGIAGSTGECCPGDYGHFNRLAADADGAVSVLRRRREVDQAHIGLLGGSQAGWIVPLAAARSDGHVSFIALVDAPVVSVGEEDTYSNRTGDNGPIGKVIWAATTLGGLHDRGSKGFDPRPYLRQLTIPGLWLYGGEDKSQPTDDDLPVLRSLKDEGKDFTVVVYPNAGHGLLDVPPTDPRALPAVVAWIPKETR
jgi:uncharacterized protein